ncbi:MAG: GatB/YqeY domain-containing protein [Acidobacteriia bacterium]|nr:GatB/YqeY domain-containing protein [Terriglobia bacterium]
MSLKDRIGEDMKAAMKSGEKDRLGVLRMMRAKVLEVEVASREKQGRDHQATDVEVVEALSSYAKQRKDSIEAFRQAGREDLASREQIELAIVREYLPRPLTDDEVRAIVVEAIAEAGAKSAKDMGAVMKLVMPRVKGSADGKKVQEIVRSLLA